MYICAFIIMKSEEYPYRFKVLALSATLITCSMPIGSNVGVRHICNESFFILPFIAVAVKDILFDSKARENRNIKKYIALAFMIYMSAVSLKQSFYRSTYYHENGIKTTSVATVAELKYIKSDGRETELLVELLTFLSGKEYDRAVVAGKVVVAQLQPLGDQQYILANADVIKNGMGSYYGYADMHPNQWGIILIILAFGNICGEYNYLFFQFLNVVGFMIAAWYIRKLTLIITENERISNLVYIEISLFMPLFMYVCFVYGTIWGLAVMTAGFCHVLSYTRTKKWYHLVFAALLLALAAIIKSNYLIGAISALLILLINAIKERRVRSIAAMAVVVIVIMAANKTEALLVKCVTGEEMDRGVNKLGYVMMGLQENNALAEGWYNGFVDTAYSEDDEEYARINDELKEMLVERLSYFAHNPNETVRFFGRKITSEWNNPSFQGFWIYGRNYHVAQDMIGNSVMLNNVLGLAGKTRISRFIICILNLLQTFTLFGVLMFCVYSFRQSGDTNICSHLILPIFFIGGFLFHLFWEAKAQYTLPYFVFLFPLALKGFVSFVKDIYDNNIKKRAVFSKATVVMLILIVMCFLIAFLPLEFNDRLFKIHDYEFLYDNVDMWN